jgi:hypothetical protein
VRHLDFGALVIMEMGRTAAAQGRTGQFWQIPAHAAAASARPKGTYQAGQKGGANAVDAVAITHQINGGSVFDQ